MKQLIGKLIFAFAGIAILIGTIVVASNKKVEAPSVVTTNFVAYDFARAVTGDASKIKMLVKPGSETHSFEPSPQDIKDIISADFFIYNGGESEEWVSNILNDNNISSEKTIKMMDFVQLKQEDGEDEYDEHIWTDPLNAIRIVNGIRDRMVAKNSAKLDNYTNNARTYTDKLENIDKQIRDIISSAKRKKLVFADRFPFRYFADEYGLEHLAAFPGCAEQTEASAETVTKIVDTVKNEQIPVILKIEQSSDALAKTISAETGAKIMTLSAAHNISEEEFSNGTTYAAIMEANLSTLKEALN